MHESELYECRQCGFCCQGETTVSLDKTDRRRMAAFLGLPETEMRDRYWRTNGNTVQMKCTDGHCIFYRQGCSIHAGKPWRCSQWPLHPSILLDEGNFTAIRDSCPGINRELSYEEFRGRLAALLAEREDAAGT